MPINNYTLENWSVPYTTDNLSGIETQNWQICHICNIVKVALFVKTSNVTPKSMRPSGWFRGQKEL